jgi:hypothetical protein
MQYEMQLLARKGAATPVRVKRESRCSVLVQIGRPILNAVLTRKLSEIRYEKVKQAIHATIDTRRGRNSRTKFFLDAVGKTFPAKFGATIYDANSYPNTAQCPETIWTATGTDKFARGTRETAIWLSAGESRESAGE